MGVEIERKFLVARDDWRLQADAGRVMLQGYLCQGQTMVVRVRRAGEQAWLTIKAEQTSQTRAEYEYSLPVADAEGLLALCQGGKIEKTRYKVAYAGNVWEVDEFAEANAGLVIAEVELSSEKQTIQLPPWVGTEVTTDRRYYNAYLAQHPYTSWG